MTAGGNIVHVVGIGTIGEPLVGLLTRHRKELGIDEVTFSKHSAKAEHRAKVRSLLDTGAKLAVDAGKRKDFESLGLTPQLEANEAIERARVVVDCTPGDAGLKERVYDGLDDGSRTFIAQGGEKSEFGKPYVLGVNDHILAPDDHFVHVVSCNTHNISAVIKALAFQGDTPNLEAGRFVCIRRSADIGQEKLVAAPAVDKHKERLGTHHATDVHRVFTTLGHDMDLYSSAMKLPTPYMHTLWFNLRLQEAITPGQAADRIKAYPYLASTAYRQSNFVFSSGRDHGFFGRILNQGVVPLDTMQVRDREITGFCFTPQDGNVLLSNLAVVARGLHGKAWRERFAPLEKAYLLREV